VQVWLVAYEQSGRIVLSSRLLATKSSNRRRENNDSPRTQPLISKTVVTPTDEVRSETNRNPIRPERVPQTCPAVNLSRLSQHAWNWPGLSPGPVPHSETPRSPPIDRGVFSRAVIQVPSPPRIRRIKTHHADSTPSVFVGERVRVRGLTRRHSLLRPPTDRPPERRLQSCRVSMTLAAQSEKPRRRRANRSADRGLLVSHKRQPGTIIRLRPAA
jgi:hypothetical protein